MSSVVIVIPARIGSTRLSNKPMADLYGKPLIVRVFEMAKQANIAEIAIACDHLDIKNVIESVGGKAYMTGNFECGTDRIYDVYSRFYNNYEYIVNLQGDMINISTNSLKEIVNNTINSKSDIGTAVVKHSKNDEIINKSQNVKAVLSVVDENSNYHKALYFTRSVAPYNAENYYIHCGIYVYNKNSIEKFVKQRPSYLEKIENLEQLRALEMGMGIWATVINDEIISIDKPEDLEKARDFLKTNNLK